MEPFDYKTGHTPLAPNPNDVYLVKRLGEADA